MTARQREARGAADEKQQRRLDEHLANQPAAAGADRQAHRDLPPPCRRARQQHAGDVGARDRQHQRDDAHQHRHERGDRRAVAGNRRRGGDAQAFAAVRVGILLLERARDAGQLALRLPDGDAGLETRAHHEPHAFTAGQDRRRSGAATARPPS